MYGFLVRQPLIIGVVFAHCSVPLRHVVTARFHAFPAGPQPCSRIHAAKNGGPFCNRTISFLRGVRKTSIHNNTVITCVTGGVAHQFSDVKKAVKYSSAFHVSVPLNYSPRLQLPPYTRDNKFSFISSVCEYFVRITRSIAFQLDIKETHFNVFSL